MRKLVVATVIVTIVGSAGCQNTRPTTVATEELPEPSCPTELQADVKVSASSVPRTIPPELTVDTGSSDGVLGRRVLVSVLPTGTARGIRILSSTLTATTLGGTLKGWAAIPDRDVIGRPPSGQTRAFDVSPGQLRISPFLNGATLQPQSASLDVLVVPGGAPMDEMAISALQMWNEDRRPISADAVKLSLTPLRHFSVYDLVVATIKLEFLTGSSRSTRERWQCSVETRITLADRDAVTPHLWDLRKSAEGRSELWLALFDQRTGPFRAIFASPGDATGFANWLRETHSTRVGQYRLGMFRPEYSDDARRTVPVGHSVTDSFQPASSDDVSNLVLGRLGEP